MDNNDKQMYTAYSLYFTNLRPTSEEIRNYLETLFGADTVDENTINLWVEKFMDIPESEKRQEETYHWDYLEHYGIDWIHSRKVNELYELFQTYLKTSDLIPVGHQGPVPISGREMKWIWRLANRDSTDGIFKFSIQITKAIWEEAVEKAVNEQERTLDSIL